MRKILALILPAVILLMSMQAPKKSRKKLLCQKWKQYGYKEFSDSLMRKVPSATAKTVLFRSDGYYEEKIFALSGKGRWRFNADQSKIGVSFHEYNGIKMEGNDTSIVTNCVIIKLKADTLIYGTEGYAGKMKGSGYDEYYFVREKK